MCVELHRSLILVFVGSGSHWVLEKADLVVPQQVHHPCAIWVMAQRLAFFFRPCAPSYSGRAIAARARASFSAGSEAAPGAIRGNGDSEVYGAAGISRDRWFHGMHAPSPTADTPLAEADLYGTLAEKHVRLTPAAIEHMYADARERTMRVLGHLDDAQLLGELEDSLNPLVWDVGHCAHFYEAMVLRVLRPDVRVHTPGTLLDGHDVDGMMDSFRADHGDRWGGGDGRALLEVSPVGAYPTFSDLVEGYYDRVVGMCLAQLRSAPVDGAGTLDPVTTYLHTLGVIHEHWHIEDFYQTLQTMGYPAPPFVPPPPPAAEAAEAAETRLPANAWGGTFALDRDAVAAPLAAPSGSFPGDARVAGGVYVLGSDPKRAPWCFDAEKAAHTVRVRPFRIAKAPVTNAEYAAFCADGGYTRREFWCHEGWRWLTRGQAATNISHHETGSGLGRGAPRYWNDADGRTTSLFDDPAALLDPHAPVCHVSWFEAQAYCAWAGRRLPTEAEWEVAACCAPVSSPAGSHAWPDADSGLEKRMYPWGDAPPSPERCNIDGLRGRPLSVDALAEGDSAFGCRQMIGNVWEWTATAFFPFPGFVPDFPYRENSCPWFGYRKVVKGGCWATSAPIARAGYRHSFWPNMDAVFTGFRTVVDDEWDQ